MTVTDWIAAVASALAVLFSAAAFRYGRRSAVAAEKSAAEAQRSAMAAERSADVAEREEQRARAEAEERAVRWALARSGDAAAHLTNSGELSAYDVRVEVPEQMRVVGGHATAAELHAGGTLRVPVSRRMTAAPGAGITVRWRNRPEGPVREAVLLVP
jgi:hypothetical protein